MKPLTYALLAAGALILGQTAARTSESAKAASTPEAVPPKALQPAEKPNTLVNGLGSYGPVALMAGIYF